MTPDSESPSVVPNPPDAAGLDEARPAASRASSSAHDLFDQARSLFDAALASFQSSLALLRAEMQLARSSASLLLILVAVFAVLGIGAWLSLLALVAAGVNELVDNWFIGVGSVVVLNALGMLWVGLAMRRCLRDMAMPRTRRMLSGLRPSTSPPSTTEPPP